MIKAVSDDLRGGGALDTLNKRSDSCRIRIRWIHNVWFHLFCFRADSGSGSTTFGFIHFVSGWTQDPDPHQNEMDPNNRLPETVPFAEKAGN